MFCPIYKPLCIPVTSNEWERRTPLFPPRRKGGVIMFMTAQNGSVSKPLFMFMFLPVWQLKHFFFFFAFPQTQAKSNTPLSSCWPSRDIKPVEKWAFSSVRAGQCRYSQSETPLGWQQNQRAHKHCVCVSSFFFLTLYWFPLSLSLSLCWKGYTGSLAP